MKTLLAFFLTLVMPEPAQKCGYAVKPSLYPYTRVNLAVEATGTDIVVWQVPSVVKYQTSNDSRSISIWVPIADDDGVPVKYWAGRYDASYTVYRAGKPAKRVEFFLVVR
jgi:hypothetical protein